MFDLVSILKSFGYLGLFAIVFAESGLLIGLFLPGDSLLFTAGVLASQGYLHIALLSAFAFTAAVLGDSFGYYFGRKIGYRIFNRENSIVFSRDHIKRAEIFYEKYGSKTIVLARFMPVIRTLAPIMAGVGKMSYPVFLTYNVIGASLWAIGLPVLGFFLGNTIPNIDHYLLPIILLIVTVSSLPTLIHLWRNHRVQIMGFLKQWLLFKRAK